MPAVSAIRNLTVTLNFKVPIQRINQANRAIKRTSRTMKRAAMAGRQFAQSLVRIATGYLGIMGAVIAFRDMIRTIANFETLRIRLETLTGSVEKAEEKFVMLRKLAQTMPFQLQELTDAAVQLGLRGFDTSAQSLTNLGNIAAGFGMSYQELTRNILSITRRQLEGFANLGITASFAGKKIHVEFDGVKKTIDNNVDSIQAYLNEVSQMPKFAGAAAKQMNSIAGLISNMKDSLAEFAYEVGQAGFLDAIKEFLGVFSEGHLAGQNLAVTLGRFLAGATRTLADWLRLAIRYIVIFKNALADAADIAKRVAVAIGLIDEEAGFFAEGLERAFEKALQIFLDIEDFIGWLRGEPSLVGEMLNAGEESRNPLLRIFQTIEEALNIIRDWITNIFTEVTTRAYNLIPVFYSIWSGIQGVVFTAYNVITNYTKQLVQFITMGLTGLASLPSMLFNNILPETSKFLTGFMLVWNTVWSMIEKKTRGLSLVLVNLISPVLDKLQQWFGYDFVNALLTIAEMVVKFIVTPIEEMINSLITMLNLAVTMYDKAMGVLGKEGIGAEFKKLDLTSGIETTFAGLRRGVEAERRAGETVVGGSLLARVRGAESYGISVVFNSNPTINQTITSDQTGDAIADATQRGVNQGNEQQVRQIARDFSGRLQ